MNFIGKIPTETGLEIIEGKITSKEKDQEIKKIGGIEAEKREMIKEIEKTRDIEEIKMIEMIEEEISSTRDSPLMIGEVETIEILVMTEIPEGEMKITLVMTGIRDIIDDHTSINRKYINKLLLGYFFIIL